MSAELFDLSDTTRLKSTTAAAMAVKADTLHALCFAWVYPTRHESDTLPR